MEVAKFTSAIDKAFLGNQESRYSLADMCFKAPWAEHQRGIDTFSCAQQSPAMLLSIVDVLVRRSRADPVSLTISPKFEARFLLDHRVDSMALYVGQGCRGGMPLPNTSRP